jgi:hypothetical protein
MLTKRFYAAIESPIKVLADDFGLTPRKDLWSLIDVQQRRGEGWITTLGRLDYGIDNVDPSCRPMFNLLPDRDQWAYLTRASAVLAVVMHNAHVVLFDAGREKALVGDLP